MWKNNDAQEYVGKLKKVYGEPAFFSQNENGAAKWIKPKSPFLEIEVKDESIPHSFPMPHKDFLYASIKLKVPRKFLPGFANVTGSIIVDGLKETVTARCAAMLKNAITLGFVQDVISGKTVATKAEYSKRIKGDLIPSWYKDELKEIKSKDDR